MFFLQFCLIIEGSGSLTNGSGSGRPKNIMDPTDRDPQHWRKPFQSNLQICGSKLRQQEAKREFCTILWPLRNKISISGPRSK
jgi:hypothetical protein